MLTPTVDRRMFIAAASSFLAPAFTSGPFSTAWCSGGCDGHSFQAMDQPESPSGMENVNRVSSSSDVTSMRPPCASAIADEM